MDGPAREIGAEPSVWFVVFDPGEPGWTKRLACGRFGHVRAFGWIPAAAAWVFYDVRLGSTAISVLPDSPEADAAIAGWRHSEGAVTLALKARPRARRLIRLGFWCVPAMAHLLGLGGCAVRPDALYRQMLAAGAEIYEHG